MPSATTNLGYGLSRRDHSPGTRTYRCLLPDNPGVYCSCGTWGVNTMTPEGQRAVCCAPFFTCDALYGKMGPMFGERTAPFDESMPCAVCAALAMSSFGECHSRRRCRLAAVCSATLGSLSAEPDPMQRGIDTSPTGHRSTRVGGTTFGRRGGQLLRRVLWAAQCADWG